MRAARLVKLYPASWRRRYGAELEGLLETRPLTLPLALDLVAGAIDAHLHPALVARNPVAAGGLRLTRNLMTRPSALIPLSMSFIALCLIVRHIVAAGVAPQADEGSEARLWQFLMAGQVPAIAYFAITWLPRSPRQAAIVLLLQGAAIGATAAPVFILHW